MSTETDHAASESTPLLTDQEDQSFRYGEDQYGEPAISDHGDHPEESPDASTRKETRQGRRVRWPTVFALVLLCLVVIAILCFGFAVPSIVKEYGQEAAVFEPVAVSIAAFTPTGVRTRIQGTFTLDAGRARSQHVRNLGRLGTWLAKEVETDESEVRVYLPEYGNVLVGTATVPRIKVNVRNGHVNNVDFLAELKAGDVGGIRVVGNDWLDKRFEKLRVRSTASVPLRSGWLYLGAQDISESFVLQGHSLHSLFSRAATTLKRCLTNSSFCRPGPPQFPRVQHNEVEYP